MTIKHIVLCGGGPVGLVSYGAIKELINNKIIKYNNIKSIYSTSIGSFVALIILFNLDYDWIDDFLIKRPWENLVNFSSTDYFSLFFTKGLCDENFFSNCLKPLFLTADIPIDITLKQFYQINKIDWHIFTSNLNTFSKVDLNHKTHPNLTIIEAITMSSSIPLLIKPPFYNDEYYLDGGMFGNCSSLECLTNENCNEYEMLSFINDKCNPIDLSNNYLNNINDISNNKLDANVDIISFIIYIIKIVFKKVIMFEPKKSLNNKNSINVCLTPYFLDINYWFYVFSNKEERSRLIKLGKSQATNFINNYDSSYNTINNNDSSYNTINNNDNNDNNDISDGEENDYSLKYHFTLAAGSSSAAGKSL